MRSQGRQTAALQGLVRVLGRGRSGAEWLVANKAAGVFVHRNEWDAVIPEEERVYADALLQQHVDRLLDCPTEPWANTPLPAIEAAGKVHVVHRLDRPASGCLLVALSAPWATLLQHCMSHSSANKTYLAHVRGTTPFAEDVEVSVPLKWHGRKKPSVSVLRCLTPTPRPDAPPAPADPPTGGSSKWVNKDSSLFLIQLRTGRFHQARRHCRFLSHPIIGDSSHGDRRVNRHWQATVQYPRLGLHCFSLDIPLPRPDRVDAYLQWSQEKQRLRDKRRLEIGNSWEEWKQRKLSIEEQLDEDDGADAPSDNAQAEELKRILALDDATERLRVLCPVPNDLLSIWRRQGWWSGVVHQLPALEWTVEEVEERVRSMDLFGRGWPIPRQVPSRFVSVSTSKEEK